MRMRLAILLLVLASGSVASVCTNLNIGTNPHYFDVVVNGVVSDSWQLETNKSRRGVVQRESDYLYVQFNGSQALQVT